LKKPTGSVRFRFYKPGTKKTEPNPNKKTRKKPSQNQAKPEKNRAKQKNEPKPKKPSQTGLNRVPNRTEPKSVGLNWFRFGFIFFKILI
jgi:hypothetical protein